MALHTARLTRPADGSRQNLSKDPPMALHKPSARPQMALRNTSTKTHRWLSGSSPSAPLSSSPLRSRPRSPPWGRRAPGAGREGEAEPRRAQRDSRRRQRSSQGRRGDERHTSAAHADRRVGAQPACLAEVCDRSCCTIALQQPLLAQPSSPGPAARAPQRHSEAWHQARCAVPVLCCAVL